MRNRGLAADYVRRAAVRVQAIKVLHDAGSWADVVRESQEAVELALKGLLRNSGIEPPRLHDVSAILTAERERLPESVHAHVDRMAAISRDLRRDQELAFYGAEDLVPSEFYGEPDALRALEGARFVVETVASVVTASD
jgi:HEPN domain-containing protein